MSDKTKILVAEGDTPLAMYMVSILTQAGSDVRTVFNGEKALEIAAEKRFDLIILETVLPSIDGFAICADLKQRHIAHRTPIVFLSNEPEEEYEARLLGAADFIQKPFNADDFISRIQSLLEETAMS